MMDKPGAIGCDKAELDALKDQVAVDTAIIKALRSEGRDWQDKCGALIGALVSERGCGSCWHGESCGADCHMNDVIEILDSASTRQDLSECPVCGDKSLAPGGWCVSEHCEPASTPLCPKCGDYYLGAFCPCSYEVQDDAPS